MTTFCVFHGKVQQRGGEIPGPTVSYYVHKCKPHKRPTVYIPFAFTKGLLVPTADCGPAKCLHFTDDETEPEKMSGWKIIAGRAGTGSGTSDPTWVSPFLLPFGRSGEMGRAWPFPGANRGVSDVATGCTARDWSFRFSDPQSLWLAPV